ncbi:hypothetical protein [Naasia lichenicola]|uniref:Uncharacterized protein n=1 Tax=Naasia lichenicola TaxID=2565933 RepID=A0A4S4FMT4_9MICO|nr:hypothetical protein [Naasia lichenicola]THG30755.1 hypothetical protein E6C64_08945 [Naasia lichenicola]THG31992.1 hypothetical protein E6C64_08090 [Naasia lichenicola]
MTMQDQLTHDELTDAFESVKASLAAPAARAPFIAAPVGRVPLVAAPLVASNDADELDAPEGLVPFDTAPIDLGALDVLPIDQTISRKALPFEYDELAEWDAITTATALHFNPSRENRRPADHAPWSLRSEIALAVIGLVVAGLALASVISGIGLNWIPIALPIMVVVVARGLLAFRKWILEATPRGTRANIALAAITSTIVTTVLITMIVVVGIRSTHQ